MVRTHEQARASILWPIFLVNMLCLGCSNAVERTWFENGTKLQKFGEEFIAQDTALEVGRESHTAFTILTPSRYELYFDFHNRVFKWQFRGDPWVNVESFDELERVTGVDEDFARYWSSALVELKTFLISRWESLPCDHVHIAGHRNPPFVGNKPEGWFFIPMDEERRPECIKGLRKVQGNWLYGILKS